MPQYQIDIIRAGHLFFLALGMGTSAYLDIRVLSRFRRPVEADMLGEFHRIHRFVFGALAMLWITGLALIWVRTGFDIAAFSPKLWLKLVVVSVLTLNALLIGLVVMPTLEGLRGAPLTALSRLKRCLLAPIAALSVFSWLSALALGSSRLLKDFNWEMLGHVFVPGFVIILLATELLALLPGQTARQRHGTR